MIPDLRRLLVGDRTVAYRRAGEGPPVVLLHGFTQDSRIWRPQLEGLADRFDMIAWDAPGAGGSPDPPDDFGIADWADTLAGFLSALEVKRANVLGLSWGGLLAQELFRRHAGRVESLILADTYAGWRGSLPEGGAEKRLAAAIEDATLPPTDFVERYLPGMFSPKPPPAARDELARIIAETHPRGFELMAIALARADTRPQLHEIRVPTLLIWGDNDARSPLDVARRMRAAIPGSMLAVIAGAGHVSNMECPEEFNVRVRKFLGSPAGREEG